MSTTYRLMPNVSDRIDLAVYTRWAIFIGVIGALGLYYYKGNKAYQQKAQLKPIAFQSGKVTEKKSKVAEKNKERVEKELNEEQCQPNLDIEVKQKKLTKASLRNARKKEARKAKKTAKNFERMSKTELDIEAKEENETHSHDIPTRARSETSDSMSQTSLDIGEDLDGFQAVTKPRKKRGPRAQPVAPASPITDASPTTTKDNEQKVPVKTNMVAVPSTFPQKKKEQPVEKATAVSEQVLVWDLDAAIIESPVARDIKPKPVVKRIAATPAPVPVPVGMVASSKSHNLRDFGPPTKSAWKPIPKSLLIPAHSKTLEEVIIVSQDETTSMSEQKEEIEDTFETRPGTAQEYEVTTTSQEVREIESPVAIEETASEFVQEQAETFPMCQNVEHNEDIKTGEASSDSVSVPTEQATASLMSPIIEAIEETQPSANPASTSWDEQSTTHCDTPPLSISRDDINSDPFDNAVQAVDTSNMTTPETEKSDRAAPSEEDQKKLLEAVAEALPTLTTEEEEVELAAAPEDDEKEITVPLCEEKTEEPSAPSNDKKNDGLTDIERKMLARDLSFDWSEEAEELAKNDIAVMGEQASA